MYLLACFVGLTIIIIFTYNYRQNNPNLTAEQVGENNGRITDEQSKILYFFALNRIREAEQPLVVSASTLCKAYNNNEILADQQYKDKSFIISGIIESIQVGAFGGQTVDFNAQGCLLGVRLEMKKGHDNFLSSLRPGQKEKLYCKFGGNMMNVFTIEDCIPVTAREQQVAAERSQEYRILINNTLKSNKKMIDIMNDERLVKFINYVLIPVITCNEDNKYISNKGNTFSLNVPADTIQKKSRVVSERLFKKFKAEGFGDMTLKDFCELVQKERIAEKNKDGKLNFPINKT